MSGLTDSMSAARPISHSIDSIIHSRREIKPRSPAQMALKDAPVIMDGSTEPICYHIDRVIRLNEINLSDTQQALDSYGRHSTALSLEREAVRRDICPKSVPMRCYTHTPTSRMACDIMNDSSKRRRLEANCLSSAEPRTLLPVISPVISTRIFAANSSVDRSPIVVNEESHNQIISHNLSVSFSSSNDIHSSQDEDDEEIDVVTLETSSESSISKSSQSHNCIPECNDNTNRSSSLSKSPLIPNKNNEVYSSNKSSVSTFYGKTAQVNDQIKAVLSDIFRRVEKNGNPSCFALNSSSSVPHSFSNHLDNTSAQLNVAKSSALDSCVINSRQQMHPNVTAGMPGLELTDPSRSVFTGRTNTSTSFFSRDTDRLVCTVCSRPGFVNRTQLTVHMKTHQIDQKRYRCDVCQQNFRSELQLDKHRRSSEHIAKTINNRDSKQVPDRRLYECLFCMRGFHNVGTLHKHLRCKAHIMGLENAGWLPCGVYAELESKGYTSNIDGPNSIQVLTCWLNYCQLQKFALQFLSSNTSELIEWQKRFQLMNQGVVPLTYPYEIDHKLPGNDVSNRPRPNFPFDFMTDAEQHMYTNN